MQMNGEILFISQFTLQARTSKGAKPDFHDAMRAEDSKVIFDSMVQQLKTLYKAENIQSKLFLANDF